MQTDLFKELEEYQKAGISLSFNGRPSNSLLIATYVREESDYMRDYQIGQNRKLCAIGFDRIKQKNTEKRFPEHKP